MNLADRRGLGQAPSGEFLNAAQPVTHRVAVYIELLGRRRRRAALREPAAEGAQQDLAISGGLRQHRPQDGLGERAARFRSAGQQDGNGLVLVSHHLSAAGCRRQARDARLPQRPIGQFESAKPLTQAHSAGRELGKLSTNRPDGALPRKAQDADLPIGVQPPYGGIAHGYLTLALAPLFIGDVLVVEKLDAALNYGLNKVRFPTAVPVGSRLRGVVTLKAADPRPSGIEAVFTVVYELEDSDRPACVAEFVAIYR